MLIFSMCFIVTLQVGGDKRLSREFEEIDLEKLWTGRRFHKLLKQSELRSKRISGTFPQVAGDKQQQTRTPLNKLVFHKVSFCS